MSEWVEEQIDYAWEWFWGPSPEQTLARASTKVRQALRQLERKRREALANEAQLLAELRKVAPRAQSLADIRSSAQAIARNRRGIARIDKLNFQLTGMQQQLLETETQNLTSSVMHDVTSSLTVANSMMGGTREVQHTLMNFQRQKAMLEFNQDQFSALDDDEAEEEDAEAIVAQLVQEQHLQLSFDLPSVAKQAPAEPPPQPPEEVPVADEEVDNLLQRFEMLKRKG